MTLLVLMLALAPTYECEVPVVYSEAAINTMTLRPMVPTCRDVWTDSFYDCQSMSNPYQRIECLDTVAACDEECNEGYCCSQHDPSGYWQDTHPSCQGLGPTSRRVRRVMP